MILCTHAVIGNNTDIPCTLYPIFPIDNYSAISHHDTEHSATSIPHGNPLQPDRSTRFPSPIDRLRKGKHRTSLLNVPYLTAHFRVSLPFGKSRRAPHEPNGQLLNKCSLSTYSGPSTGCHQATTIKERQKKLFKAFALQPHSLSSNSSSVTSWL